MKARTKIHREIVELSSTLPALNEKDIADARKEQMNNNINKYRRVAQ